VTVCNSEPSAALITGVVVVIIALIWGVVRLAVAIVREIL
jgi:hypothetical protein